jgi:acetoacetate decarboxylase
MSLKHHEGWSIPFDHPFYPPLPAHYRQVQFQYVFFRADAAGIARLLPEPLEVAPGGLCVAAGLRVPFCTSYGAFNEALVQLQCLFRGQLGWYCSHVWHDGPSGIAAGREIYGTPKIFATLDVQMAGPTMVTRSTMAEMPVVAISSTMTAKCDVKDIPRMTPAWRLKIIPRADGPGPALKQLIDASAASQDFQAHVCLRGKGVVRFDPSPLCDITFLQPVAYLDAYYLEASYTETFATIAYDYLAEQK